MGLFGPKKGLKATKIKRFSVASIQDAWNDIPMDYIKSKFSILKRITVFLAVKVDIQNINDLYVIKRDKH